MKIEIIRPIDSLAGSLRPWQWWLLAAATALLSQLTVRWLNDLYAESLFPVSYYVGQTTFDAAELKSYYAVLLDKGTLDKYVGVQIADFVFMATTLAAFAAVTIAVYRSLPAWNPIHAIGRTMIAVAPCAALFDALENTVSFIMLADPLGFADWLVYPYSSFAVTKFAVFALTYIWVAAGIATAVGARAAGWFFRRTRAGTSQ